MAWLFFFWWQQVCHLPLTYWISFLKNFLSANYFETDIFLLFLNLGFKFSKKFLRSYDIYILYLVTSMSFTLNLLYFSNELVHHPFQDLFIIIFRDIKMADLKLDSQQQKAIPNCTDMKTGLALYCWHVLAYLSI